MENGQISTTFHNTLIKNITAAIYQILSLTSLNSFIDILLHYE